jgi:hypothetical protein
VPLSIVGLGLACLGLASLAAGTTDLAGSSVSAITVTLDEPSEFAFRLSPSQASGGTVVFNATNTGRRAHDFTLRAQATGSGAVNAFVDRLADQSLAVRQVANGGFSQPSLGGQVTSTQTNALAALLDRSTNP